MVNDENVKWLKELCQKYSNIDKIPFDEACDILQGFRDNGIFPLEFGTFDISFESQTHLEDIITYSAAEKVESIINNYFSFDFASESVDPEGQGQGGIVTPLGVMSICCDSPNIERDFFGYPAGPKAWMARVDEYMQWIKVNLRDDVSKTRLYEIVKSDLKCDSTDFADIMVRDDWPQRDNVYDISKWYGNRA